MADGPYVVVARVLRTHGLKGEVSVASATGAPFSLLTGADVWFVPPGSVRNATVSAVRPGPRGDIVAFSGVDCVDIAVTLRGTEVLARSDALPEGWTEYSHATDELDGYAVFDKRHGDLGVIEETIHTGANDVWIVQGRLGEVLIPVIDDVVESVDSERRVVAVKLLDGLLPGSEND